MIQPNNINVRMETLIYCSDGDTSKQLFIAYLVFLQSLPAQLAMKRKVWVHYVKPATPGEMRLKQNSFSGGRLKRNTILFQFCFSFISPCVAGLM
jgi:hypothetical protein